MPKSLVQTLLIIALLSAATIFAGCIEWSRPGTAPQNVTATQGTEEDRITLTWDVVPRAGVYYVYRSPASDGDYAHIGSTANTEFIDVAMDPEIHYWYVVSVTDYLGRPAFELASPGVEGWAYHTFSWATSTVAIGGFQGKIAVDPDDADIAYIVSTENDESGISVSSYSAGAWDDAGEDFGVVNGAIPGGVAITLYHGTPYVAYLDEGAGGKISVQSLIDNGDTREWMLSGASGQGATPARDISTSYGTGGLFVASLLADAAPDSIGVVQVLLLDSGGIWTSVPPSVAQASNPRLIRADAGVALAYEDETVAADKVIRIKRYASGWSDIATLDFSSSGTDNIPDGYMDFTYESGAFIVSFYNEGTQLLHVYRFTSAWEDISPSVTADPSIGSIAVAADQGNIYLFYRDLVSSRGTIMKYEAAWTVVPLSAEQAGVTGQYNVAAVDIEARNNMVYSVAVVGGGVNVYVYR